MQIQTTGNGVLALNKAGSSGPVYNPSGYFSEVLVSELMPQYYGLVKAGLVWSLSTPAAGATTLTSYSGASAGTPLWGIYNGSASKDIVILQHKLTIRSPLTVATISSNYWSVNYGVTAPTGTATVPKNVYTSANSGSIATSWINTAITGPTATMLGAGPSIANTTVSFGGPELVDDIKGSLIIAPGGFLAFGVNGTATGLVVDANVLWTEVPF